MAHQEVTLVAGGPGTASVGYPAVELDSVRSRLGMTTVLGPRTVPAEGVGSVVVEALGRGWASPAGGDADANVVRWSESDVVVQTSRQNLTPVYAWTDESRTRLLLGTDLAALTARVLSSTEGPTSRPAELVTRVRAARESIWMIPAHTTVQFSSAPGDSRIAVTSTARAGYASHQVDDAAATDAGRRQLDALSRSVGSVTPHGAPVTALVSGGVDSALVAALAQRVGILDGIATLGTVWGDERAEADELGADLGLPVQYATLSEDDIVGSLPETIRMLGEPSQETVAITSNLVALFRSGAIPAGVLLTGYGSDLINSGLRVGSGLLDDVGSAVVHQLEHAGRSGEFSGVAAAHHGYVLHHPFWSSEVIEAALATSPDLLRHGGREKGHLRAAAEELVSSRVAWRPKRALHRGSGVDDNLASAVARRIGERAVDVQRFYACVDAQMVDGLLRSSGGDLDAGECIEAAAHLYKTTA